MTSKVAIACVIAWLPVAAWAASPVGVVGYYATLHVVTAAQVTGGAGQCYDKAGTGFLSSLYYPGPGKPGTTDREPIDQASLFGEAISTFPVQPAAGVTHWAGTYTFRFLPAGPVTKATFVSDTTIFDARSSISVFTFSYSAPGGGTCTETLHNNYTYSGH